MHIYTYVRTCTQYVYNVHTHVHTQTQHVMEQRQKRIYMNICIYCIYMNICIYIHTICISCTYTHAYIHICILCTYTRACTDATSHGATPETHMYEHMYTYTHANIHTCIHTHMYAHTHNRRNKSWSNARNAYV